MLTAAAAVDNDDVDGDDDDDDFDDDADMYRLLRLSPLPHRVTTAFMRRTKRQCHASVSTCRHCTNADDTTADT